jgi:V/A-type H+-transporting ATPase subunit E
VIDNESVDKIVSQIREDGEAEIRSILEKAESTAADILKKAEEKNAEAVEQIMKEAREKGEAARKRLLSSVSIEVKRTRLKAREEVVAGIRRKVEKVLSDARGRDDYPELMARLAGEAIEALGGGKYEVFADKRDIGLLEEKVFPILMERTAKQGDKIESLKALPLEKNSLGGLRVGVPGGRVLFDNTYEARMYRMRDRIRNMIFDRVFETEGSEDPGSA